MTRWPSIVVLVLFFLPMRANGSDLDLSAIKINALRISVDRLRGRVLGLFIISGMTCEQVDYLLGADAVHLDAGSLAGSSEYWSRRYPKYGLIISFHGHNGRPLCVDSVRFLPLTEKEKGDSVNGTS